MIIPTHNDAAILPGLLERMHRTLSLYGEWEAIIVDERSADNLGEMVRLLALQYPIKLITGLGKNKEAQLICEGLKAAQYPILAVFNAGAEYRPEDLGVMWEGLMAGEADVVVTRRNGGAKKTVGQRMFQRGEWLFMRLMFGLNYDAGSSLIMFSRQYLPVATSAGLKNFNLSFLWHAAQAGARIAEQDILYIQEGKRVDPMRTVVGGLVMAWEALLIRLRGLLVVPFADGNQIGQAGSGICYKDKKYITHNYLPPEQSAFKRFNRKEIIILILIAICLGFGFHKNWQATLVGIVGAVSLIYLMDVIFMFLLSARSLLASPEIKAEQAEIDRLKDEDLPVYTVLCPLYKEPEVVEQFVEAMRGIDWPTDKLDVQLLIEEDDQLTQEMINWMVLPPHIQVRIVPPGLPKTKPKACNYGLAHAKGEYVVIFDAEDIPEPDQLKKAYIAFQKVEPEVVCMQARLDYFNAKQNLLTRLFATEYNLWFGVILPGLYALQAPIPLGGTSNHFRRMVLDELSGWDPFNVTEDCDLGIRLFSLGYRTAIIDSNTHEEANSQLGNWIRQRSRWIKGYAQTQLVAWRKIDAIALQGWDKFIIFILVFVHKAFSLFINPLLWLLTIGYFLAPHMVQPLTKMLFSGPIGYIGAFTMIVGNFLYFYSHILAAIKTKQWWMVKYTFVIPFYWLLMSVAGWYGMWQLIVKPHYWEKTRHGLSAQPKKIWVPLASGSEV